MITKIEAVNYRSLRYISQEVAAFQVLIGPNASGKSTFMDILSLISDIISKPNIEEVIRSRVRDFRDLLWMRDSEWFELAVEVSIPEQFHRLFKTLRYEVRVGIDEQIVILRENLWMSPASFDDWKKHEQPLSSFNFLPVIDRITHHPDDLQNARSGFWQDIIIYSSPIAVYQPEEQNARSSQPFYNRGAGKKLQRSNLPYVPDPDEFPITTWFREYMSGHIQKIALDSEKLRQASPAQSARGKLLENGTNLPWVIQRLKEKAPDKFQDWLAHIQTALPDVKDIITFERPEDGHRYLQIAYANGLTIPSWVVSDGTLRLLALTILAYLPDFEGIYLIEEPENGVHPRILEAIYQSLNSIYESQVFLATHSPIFLNLVEPERLLCFVKQENGETQIIRGDLHPRLEDWQGEVSLSTLFASGVLE